MKNTAYILIALIALTATYCSKQEKDSTFITNVEMTKSFTSGKWHLIAEDKKMNSTYNGYEFSFKPDNSILIDNGKNTYYGKWYVFNDNGTDDTPPTDTEFQLSFAPSSPLKLAIFNHNYHIIMRTKNELKLLSIDALNLEKIEFKKI